LENHGEEDNRERIGYMQWKETYTIKRKDKKTENTRSGLNNKPKTRDMEMRSDRAWKMK
jgi:hypothetical protein